MKKAKWVMILALAGVAAHAQAFNSGSDGSYGAINITADTTLDVPPNGIFNCTTINVTAGRTLRFRRNAMNTPVYLLATGNINIAGVIDVSASAGNSVIGGLGGPGGFDGGSPGSVSAPPGSGYGPGAGRGGSASSTNPDGAGAGSFSTVSATGGSTNKGVIYGNALLVPLIGGSGGGGCVGTPGSGGGGGGGAILFASSTRIDIPSGGRVDANGATYTGGPYNGGSGGAIRLVAPIVAGSGALRVDSPSGSGYGRIRVDAIDRTQLALSFTVPQVTSVGSMMVVFPNPLPRLDIIEAAGTAIPEGSGPVSMQLPFGSSPNRTIKIQAKDFNARVPITLVLTPDHGTRVLYTNSINNVAGSNPAILSMDVVLPVNEQTTVSVFSK